MILPKKVIGTWFVLTGFVGGMYGAYLQMAHILQLHLISAEALTIYYFLLYFSFLGSWYALFDYKNQGKINADKPKDR